MSKDEIVFDSIEEAVEAISMFKYFYFLFYFFFFKITRKFKFWRIYILKFVLLNIWIILFCKYEFIKF